MNFLWFLFTPAFLSKFKHSDSYVQGSFTSHCFADGVVTWFVLANCISATLARYKLFNSITWLTCADQDAAAALKQPLQPKANSQNSCSASELSISDTIFWDSLSEFILLSHVPNVVITPALWNKWDIMGKLLFTGGFVGNQHTCRLV